MIIPKLDFNLCLNKAKEKAQLMIDNWLYSRFNLSDKERLDKATLWCMWEIVFEKYLKEQWIEYSLDTTNFQIKNSDEFDFLINNKKVDIKVAKKTTINTPNDNWTYWYPEEQSPINKDFVVIWWVDFTNQKVWFYWWIEWKKISLYKVVTKNSFAWYPYLTPNHEFKWGELNKDFNELLKILKNK